MQTRPSSVGRRAVAFEAITPCTPDDRDGPPLAEPSRACAARRRAMPRICASEPCVALALLRSCALALLRSCAFTSSPAARFARRRPAFGESAQPAFVGPPI
ncbi:hypothetical protein BURPSS13_C0065 [Burkholderia pseudomallei S13]|nr:hypothetical protein BURPSS13_C0065 [Burkholderia pseudomallei S13]